jgi:peptidoglycan/xylan/chitin deacetylase (PgdA/CDA1 family)
LAGARYSLIRFALDAMAATGLDRLLAPQCRGRGVILTCHHVRPARPGLLDENAGLAITPAFLETAIETLRALDYDIVPIGEVPHRLAGPPRARPFAVLTFDDGYLDNLHFALPILRRQQAPFTLFVCAGFAERTAPLWWLDIEDAVERLHTIRLELPGEGFLAPAATEAEKRAAARALYWRLRTLDEDFLQGAVAALCRQAGVDQLARVERLCMDWDGLRTFAGEPLATLGAHTLSHPRLARLEARLALAEMARSRLRIEEMLGVEARHIAYPVGDPGSAGGREFAFAAELGFETGVTTVPGVLKPEDARRLLALPRISLNGLFQQASWLRTLVSGVPFALSRRA